MTHEDAHGFAFESAVASLKPGATFGETAMRFDGHRPTTGRARVGGSRVLRVFKSDFERAWEMEREAVERETRDARARRAAARRRRRAERRARRCRRRQKRTLSATVSSTPHSDASVCSSGSESELDSEDDLARTTVDPNDLKSFTLETSRDPPTRVALSELSSELSKKRDVSNRTADTVKKRSLLPWEREFLASLLTTVTYDPGDALPVAPQCDDETTGDPLRDATEDAYFGFVLAGELIVSSSRGVGVEKKKKVDVITAGQTFYSLAARETRDGRVARYGVETVRVSAAKDAEPAKVALLQGMDVLELPKSLRDLLFRRAVVHARWRPPPRHAPRSTAEPDSESEASEEEEEEEGGGVLTTVPDVRSPPSSSGGSHVGLDMDAPAWDDRGLFREFVLELVEAFKHVDTDRGGDIDENELKFAARSLGFEPNPRRLRAMLAAMDEDGGGSVDLGEFINVVSKRIVDAVDPDALDAAFDAFDEKRTGRITFDDIQKVAFRVGDFVASDELEALMNLGAADLDGDGCIDRAEFGEIMRVRETDTAARRAALRREIKRQKDASEDAAVVVEMLGEYDVERDSADRSRVFEEKEKNAKGGVAGAALAAAAKAHRDEERKKKETPLRATLRAVFDGVARLGVSSKTDDEDGNRRDASEIDVRDLIRALRLDAEGDGSLARALHLPQRLTLRRDDGTAERFEVMFREMDADGSGSVDFEEFFNYFRRLKKERAAEVVARAVVRFDEIGARDGDGDDDDDGDDENKETTRDNLGVVGLSNGLAASFRAKIAARRAANERGAREENDGLVAAGALGRTT
jgi:Ca2+-binding EF-hand superfamily protein